MDGIENIDSLNENDFKLMHLWVDILCVESDDHASFKFHAIMLRLLMGICIFFLAPSTNVPLLVLSRACQFVT